MKRTPRTLALLGTVPLALLGASCAAFTADAQKTEAAILSVEPQVAADADCIVEALAADPNILNPVNDLALAEGVYACFATPDGGSTVTPGQALTLVAKHRATAATLARSRKAKMAAVVKLPVDAGSDG